MHKLTLVMIIVLLPPALVGIVDLWSRFWRPHGATFDIRSDYGPFHLPLPLRPQAQGAAMKGTLAQFQPDTLQAYTTISIKNTGDRSAEKLAIQFEGRGIALISRQDGKTTYSGYQNRLEIGELAVEESVTVSLWTNLLPTDRNRPTLVHSFGTESVDLPRKVMGARMSATRAFWYGAGMIMTIILVGTWLLPNLGVSLCLLVAGIWEFGGIPHPRIWLRESLRPKSWTEKAKATMQDLYKESQERSEKDQ